MKDKFDQYFEKHRPELDIDEPNRHYLWESIEAELFRKKYRRRLLAWKLAAAIFAILAVGEFTYLFISKQAEPVHHLTQGQHENEYGAFEILEISYQREVEALRQQVELRKINPAEYAMLLEELEYIEEVEDDFMADIPLVNDKERLAEILVDTYEKKIHLLERLLMQIERNEKQKQKLEESHLPVDYTVKPLSL